MLFLLDKKIQNRGLFAYNKAKYMSKNGRYKKVDVDIRPKVDKMKIYRRKKDVMEKCSR
ncbi:hypothetical protein GCM10007968_05160 [Sporolactobacillus putidus]|uniref:Uncharacterized protein n=1 Tax=Sporolactobacillus putidus TaxID=492735 RepID=A0A917RYF6_9BACL|nr:hypothetical protein GCM10007968_05160 [Sporolactobacillus putidus]